MYTREESIERREQSLDNRENSLEEKENNLINKQNVIQGEEAKVEEIKKQQLEVLEKIACYTKDEAKEVLFKKIEDEASLEIAAMIKEKEAEAKLTCDK